MSDTIRIGAIGSGGNARGHMRRLSTMDGVELVAITDPSEEAIKAAFDQVEGAEKLPTFEDHGEMLSEVEMDAVVISTPHTLHFDQIMDSLGADLHVLCEKPMVCTVAQAKEVREAEKGSRKVLAISYQRHCLGRYQYIRNSIAGGQPGKVKFVAGVQNQEWLMSQKGTWRQNMKLACGGQLNDSGSHLLDAVLWMTGLQAQEVYAGLDFCGREVDINSAMAVKFKGDALGTFAVLGSTPIGLWEDITIVCENWAFFMHNADLTVSTGGEVHKLSDFAYGSPSPDHNFVEAIRRKAKVLAPSVCGLRTIELTEAAWKAGKTGKPVKL